MHRSAAHLTLVALSISLAACTVLGPDDPGADSVIDTQTVVILSPAADTYVRSGSYATRAFGTASTVSADSDASGTTTQGYVRFDVGDVGSIAHAKLRLYVTNGSSSSANLVVTSNVTWTETMTWNSRVAADGETLASLGKTSKGAWVELDVTPWVVSGAPLSFAIIPRSGDGFAVSSRQATSNRPELIIERTPASDPDVDAGTGDPDPDPDPPPPSSALECLSRPSRTVLSGTYTDGVSISSPPRDHAVDARTALSLTSGERALEIGSSSAAEGACVVGWTTIGQQSRTLSWRTMHDDIGGSALRVYGSNYLVDGLRADNVEDGFDPRGGENFELRNMWASYVRDDCIENDERHGGRVTDSLFDGCYTFFSEQEVGETAGESLIFDHVLARLRPMPAPRGTEDPAILGHGSFFKKFDDGGRHEPEIRDSIFFLEDDCYSGCKDWPPGTTASNVTIVWVGQGAFPMSVLPGMTLTQNRAVWDQAVARWKTRHGCTTIDKPCTSLHNPAPY